MTVRVLQWVSWLALAGTVGAPLAFLTGSLGLAAMQTVLLVSTAVWFACSPWWVGRRREG